MNIDITPRTAIRQRRWIGRRIVSIGLLVALAAIVAWTASAQEHETTLYVFTQEGCPACARMAPVIDRIEADYPALAVQRLELTGPRGLEYRALLIDVGRAFNIQQLAVPAVFVGDSLWIGFNEAADGQIREAVERCLGEGCVDLISRISAREAAEAVPPPVRESAPPPAGAPQVMGISVGRLPIVVSTAFIAFIDGFNPCSLWVLTFLLAMVMHTGSRKRVLLVGSVFLLVTALIYGLFIVGVVQAVALIGHIAWIRIVVVLIALAMGAINIKDYFAWKQGVSLTLSSERQGWVARRFAGLSRSSQHPAMLVLSTAGLASGIAVIELPCTAGFPVVWSNLIAAAAVPVSLFALLLALYLLIYLSIELALVVGATVAFRRAVITEGTGRLLKLIGGTIMVALALVLLFDPELMESLVSMLIVFGIAAALALLLALVDRGLRASRPAQPVSGTRKPTSRGRNRKR